MKIGIDLALRKIGIVVLDDNNKLNDFILLDSDPKKYKDEILLVHNNNRINNFLEKLDIDKNTILSMEGLSFNSKSSEIDLIDANHWIIRITIKTFGINPNIIYPKSWQKNIVTKDVLAIWVKDWPIIRAKKGMKLTKEQKTSNNKSKAEIRKKMKQFIYDALPDNIKSNFNEYIKINKLNKDGIYDLADAYFIALYGN